MSAYVDLDLDLDVLRPPSLDPPEVQLTMKSGTKIWILILSAEIDNCARLN